VLLDLPWAAGDDARSLALDGAVAPDSARGQRVGGPGWRATRDRADGSSGEPIASVELPDFHPYAAAFDACAVVA
jgi:hypothetical protein